MARTFRRRRYGRSRRRRGSIRRRRRFGRSRRRLFRRSSSKSRRRPVRVSTSSAGISIAGRARSNSYHIKHRKAISYPRDMEWDIVRTQGAGRVSANVNQQGYTGRTFLQGSANVNLGSSFATATGYGSDLVAHGIPFNATDLNVRRIMLKTQTDLIFNNLCNATVSCRLYILRCRQSMTHSSDPVLNEHAFHPESLWNYLADNSQNPNTSSTIDPLDIGVTPYMTPAFGSFWHIVADKKFQLDAGSQYRYTVTTDEHYSYNWLKLGSAVGYSSGVNICLKGRTWGYMLAFHGQPACDDNTPSFVGFSPANIGINWVHRMWTATARHPTQTLANVSNTYDPGLTGNPTAFVQDETGAVVNYDAA